MLPLEFQETELNSKFFKEFSIVVKMFKYRQQDWVDTAAFMCYGKDVQVLLWS